MNTPDEQPAGSPDPDDGFLELGDAKTGETGPAAPKPQPDPANDIRNNPAYQKALGELKNLQKDTSRLRVETRELYRQKGKIVSEVRAALKGSAYGEGIIEKLGADLGTHPSALYDACAFYELDPSEESELIQREENIPWDWVRVLVHRLKSHADFVGFLDEHAPFAALSREDFTRKLDEFVDKGKVQDIKDEAPEDPPDDETEEEEEEPSEEDEDDPNDPTLKKEEEVDSETLAEVRHSLADEDSYPDWFIMRLALLKQRSPLSYAKLTPTGDGNNVGFIVEDLDASSEDEFDALRNALARRRKIKVQS